MKAFVLDRQTRTARIEDVRRESQVIYRKDGQYAMKGVSWAWGVPMYPRRFWFISFVPFIGPFISAWALTRDTFAIIADGVPSTLEPESDSIVPSMTDKQALSIMEAHAEAMSIGTKTFSPLIVAMIIIGLVAVVAIVGLVR